MPGITDITNRRFGSWTVIAKGDCVRPSEWKWLCRCDCGVERQVFRKHLVQGTSASCGCQIASLSNMVPQRGTKPPASIVSGWPCANDASIPVVLVGNIYGKRGITICAEWPEFTAFRDWSLAHGYADHLTINRIDNNLGYAPWNCDWVGLTEQNRNKRNTKITVEKAALIRRDMRKTAEIARAYSVSETTILRIKAGRVWR